MSNDPRLPEDLPEYNGPEPRGDEGADLDDIAPVTFWTDGVGYLIPGDPDESAASSDAADTN